MACNAPLNEITSLAITRVEAGQLIGTLTPGTAGGSVRVKGGVGKSTGTCVVGGDGSRAILVESMSVEVERLRAKVGDVRQKIEPLLKHLKVLTPA